MIISSIILCCTLAFSPMNVSAQTLSYSMEVPFSSTLDQFKDITNEDVVAEELIQINELTMEEVEAVDSELAINHPDYKEDGEHIYYSVNDKGYSATLSKELQDWVYVMCEEYGISGYEKMIMAKLYCESSYNPNTIHKNTNGTTDYGIAQINSCNHERLKQTLGITDFLDPYQSIRCGVFMMSECLEANNFNEGMALAAYNTGRNGITSTSYTKRVLSIKESASIIGF